MGARLRDPVRRPARRRRRAATGTPTGASRELEADGIVAEVDLPQHDPAVLPDGVAPRRSRRPPTAGDLERRWAGLRAHNRWLADFCAERAGPARRASRRSCCTTSTPRSREIRWAKDAGLTGGVLLPGAPPERRIAAAATRRDYEPIWAVCEELGMPVNHHGGSAAPPMGARARPTVIFLLEVDVVVAPRAVAPDLLGRRSNATPICSSCSPSRAPRWVPETPRDPRLLLRPHAATPAGRRSGVGRRRRSRRMSLKPSEYWARQCHVGASFIRPTEVPLRDASASTASCGAATTRTREASYPYSREAMRLAFAGVDPARCRRCSAATRPTLYGFDLDALAPIVARVGPTVAEICRAARRRPRRRRTLPRLRSGDRSPARAEQEAEEEPA